MRLENGKHETGNGKPVIAHLFASVFHFPFPVFGFRFFIRPVSTEKIDTPVSERGRGRGFKRSRRDVTSKLEYYP